MDAVVERARGAVHAALVDKASLLASPALRERLAQGAGEPFIDGLLAAGTAEEVAEYLAQTFRVSETLKVSDPVELLARYLKKLRVRKVRLADFRPSKRTVERADVEAVVAEFRRFLLKVMAADEDELSVVELE